MERITIFAAPRPFEGDFERIQRNAIFSWTCLEPRPEILVFGGGARAAAVCDELGVRSVPEVSSTASGAPMLDSLFAAAQQVASNEVLAYANPDVIFLQEVVVALERASVRFGRFIAVGAPRNAQFGDTLRGPVGEWRSAAEPAIARATRPARGSGADLFVFPCRALDPIPPIAIGRLGWDNWLLWRCATNALPSIDITDAAALIHQDHSGSTHRGSLDATHERFGEEVRDNLGRLGRLDVITRRSEIPYAIRADGTIARRFRGSPVAVRTRLSARYVRLGLLSTLRRTPFAAVVNVLERWWKGSASG